MAPEKETTMVLKVDLDCYRCYTKVKRTLCSFPQVRDQIYNTKQNLVMIKVVCCSPEKIRDKLFYKGGKSIKGIDIVEQKKPADDKPPADKPAGGPPADKPSKQVPPPADKPANKPKDAQPAPAADKPAKKNVTFEGAPPSKPKDAEGGAPPSKAKGDAPPSKAKGDASPSKPQGGGDAPPAKPKGEGAPKPAEQAAAMAYMMPPAVYGYGYPVNVGCLDCYEGRMCYQHGPGNGYGYGGYGVPPPPPPAPAGGWGYCGGGPGPSGYGQNYKPGYCVSRYGDYVSEENANGCVVM